MTATSEGEAPTPTGDQTSEAYGLDGSVAFPDDGWRSAFARVCFGDRIGFACFLGALVVFALFWITDWRINDTVTLLNALHSLSEGNLAISSIKYPTEGVPVSEVDTPGTAWVDGEAYGRNYGVLALSLVPLAIVRVLAAVTELRIAFAGLWSLGILAFALVLGRIVGRRRLATYAGSAVALLLFVANVAVATPLDPSHGELYALQITHVVAAAFVVVFVYRLLARMQEVESAVLGAVIVALGTPLGFWATIPKRHAVTAAVVFVVAYSLYRSRTDATAAPCSPLFFRAVAYATVGLYAWVHAPEALLLLCLLVAADLPTAVRNDARTLAVLAGIGLASSLPFLLTNYLIAGSPIEPPRIAGGGAGGGSSSGSSAGSSGGSSGGSGGITDLLAPILDPILSVAGPLLILFDLFAVSLRDLFADPGQLTTIFLRSGYVDSIADEANVDGMDLAVLESAPVLGAVAGAVPVLASRLRRTGWTASRWPPSSERVVDGFFVAFAVLLSLLYVSRLPLHAQITVRYLFPLFPVLVVLAMRLPAMRTLAREHWRTFAWTYAAAVLIGGQALLVVLVVLAPGIGEAFQFHALLGLAAAAPLAAWAARGRADGRYGQAGAVLLALATATATLFFLFLTLDYYPDAGVARSQALPLVRAVADQVEIV